MAVVKKALVLNFETGSGSKLGLSILKPMEGLGGSEIKTAMETIITSGAFGAPEVATKIVGAEYDIRQVEEIVLG
ncbi:MAG: DUF2922 domain-containing protein [Cellulosilyticaceae bacterium]